MYDARTTDTSGLDVRCTATVPGSHPRPCIREAGHIGRHRATVRCIHCESRPARHPRAWANARVTGPALCARCARDMVAQARLANAAPTEDM